MLDRIARGILLKLLREQSALVRLGAEENIAIPSDSEETIELEILQSHGQQFLNINEGVITLLESGLYKIVILFVWENNDGGTIRIASIAKNNQSFLEKMRVPLSGVTTNLILYCASIFLEASDELEIIVGQDSGDSLDLIFEEDLSESYVLIQKLS